MNLWGRILAVCIISIGLAWLLSYLPELEANLPNGNDELQVFNHNNPIILTEQNLVDWIAMVPLQMRMKRVDWSDRILSVDFETEVPIESPSVIYNQLLDFIYFGIGGSTNVERVWVRLLQSPEIGGQSPRGLLLLALDANRTQISEEDYDLWKSGHISAEQLIHSHFHLTVTPQWTRLLQQ